MDWTKLFLTLAGAWIVWTLFIRPILNLAVSVLSVGFTIIKQILSMVSSFLNWFGSKMTGHRIQPVK